MSESGRRTTYGTAVGGGSVVTQSFETEVSKLPPSTSTTTQLIQSNSLHNSSQSLEDDVEFYYFYKEEQLTFLWILFATIVIGNTSVLISTSLRSNSRKSRMNFFIKNLAIADLLVGLITVLTDIIWKYSVEFRGGDYVCRGIKFLQVLVTYSSTYVLVSLSIDRYDAIKNPLDFSRRWKRARLLIVIAWSLSFIFALPAIYLNELTIINGRPQCWIHLEPWEWKWYITIVAVSLFFIPAIIIAACYAVIVNVIWRRGRNQAPFPATSSTTTTGFGTTTTSGSERIVTASTSRAATDDAEFRRASSRGVIPRAKIKSVKMTLVIVFAFILCWSPYFIWDLLQVYGYIPVSQRTIAISTFIQSLAPLNSAANPIIYYLFTTHFCRSIR